MIASSKGQIVDGLGNLCLAVVDDVSEDHAEPESVVNLESPSKNRGTMALGSVKEKLEFLASGEMLSGECREGPGELWGRVWGECRSARGSIATSIASGNDRCVSGTAKELARLSSIFIGGASTGPRMYDFLGPLSAGVLVSGKKNQ